MNIDFFYTDNSKIRYAYMPPIHDDIYKGQVIILPGRSSFLEQYLEPILELQKRGFKVWAIDWRGQGGSARYIEHPQKNHITDFNYSIKDLHNFMSSKITSDHKPIFLLGISLGSHIGLRYLLKYSERVTAGIFFMSHCGMGITPSPLGEHFSII